MRYLIAFILVSFFFLSKAQIVNFNVEGVVQNNTSDAKFAYLTTLSQQIPVSSDKLFMMVPVVDGKFKFTGTFNLDGNNFQQACVFVDDRGNISKEEVASKFKQLIWITSRNKNMKLIVLEVIKLAIKERDSMKNALIVGGGKLSKQLYLWSAAVRAGAEELILFVKSNPDSPVSIYAINSYMMEEEEDIRKSGVLPTSLFLGLSERLKKSKEGQSLKKKVDAWHYN